MKILGIDPGYAHMGIVTIDWAPRVRSVVTHRTITTSPKDKPPVRWGLILHALNCEIASALCPDVIACEEMTGVRHGHTERGTTSASTDELIEVQGAIRAMANHCGKQLFLIRSLSSYTAAGIRIPTLRNETRHARSKRQKAAAMATVKRLFGASELTEHEADAVVHALGVAMGKGAKA